MLKWYCDICEQEIVMPEHPVRIALYSEGVNRDLEDYDNIDYHYKAIAHRACVNQLVVGFKPFIKGVQSLTKMGG